MVAGQILVLGVSHEGAGGPSHHVRSGSRVTLRPWSNVSLVSSLSDRKVRGDAPSSSRRACVRNPVARTSPRLNSKAPCLRTSLDRATNVYGRQNHLRIMAGDPVSLFWKVAVPSSRFGWATREPNEAHQEEARSLILMAGSSHIFGSRVRFYVGVLGARDFGDRSNDAIRQIDTIDPSNYTPNL